ncbi:MAG: Mini-ribonuclease 3 [Clostridia bacterium]|nr:Mini-ribonuclease 3 [Clostridia bacterium]
MDSVKLLSPSVLAFVGDAVYSLLVRTYLADKQKPSDTLHKEAVEFVSAGAQAKAFAKIKESLTEKELEIFTRGRNFHTNNTPKSSSPADYHTATGLEALFGYLHLEGSKERIEELFNIIIGQ